MAMVFFFFLGHTQRHIFRLKGPTHNRSMGFQNNWYYALLIDWSFGLQCIFFFITLTSSVSSGHVLRKGRPGSTVPAGVSPCSCEYKCASRVSSQFIFTPRNCMSRSQLILVLSISKWEPVETRVGGVSQFIFRSQRRGSSFTSTKRITWL